MTGRLNIHHAAGSNAAKLLTTAARNARTAGPGLREAHRRLGNYLATESVSRVVGLNDFDIPHVQGSTTVGQQLLHERRTAIVALMRGGEPLALGINDASPLAMFIHAAKPEDVRPQHVEGLSTIVLVDSVVNSGKTVLDFVDHVWRLQPTVRVVVVANVVQAQSVRRHGPMIQALSAAET